MSLALLRENEKLFMQALEAPASVRLGRSVFAMWRIATQNAREAERLLAGSVDAKARLAKAVDAQISHLDVDDLRVWRNELAGHLNSLKETKSETEPELLQREQDLQVHLEELGRMRGVLIWFARRQVAKALSASVAIRFAAEKYDEAVEYALREKLDPALNATTMIEPRRVITMADRQFSPERQAAIREKIGIPSPETMEWGRKVAERLKLQ